MQVLRCLVRELHDSGVDWAVTAGMGLYLQGVPVKPQDIDLRTDQTGAHEIERRFCQFVVKPVKFSSTGSVRSLFGALVIDGIEVEIIGDLETKHDDGQWLSCGDWRERRLFINLGDLDVPVLPLELEYELYMAMGRGEKASMVRRWLDKA